CDLPGRSAVPVVLQHNARGCEFVADAIRFGKVLSLARCGAGGDQGVDAVFIDLHSLTSASEKVARICLEKTCQAPGCPELPFQLDLRQAGCWSLDLGIDRMHPGDRPWRVEVIAQRVQKLLVR